MCDEGRLNATSGSIVLLSLFKARRHSQYVVLYGKGSCADKRVHLDKIGTGIGTDLEKAGARLIVPVPIHDFLKDGYVLAVESEDLRVACGDVKSNLAY